MNHILQTTRLTLREFTLQDAPFIVELLNSEGWLKFIGDRNVRTLAEAEGYLIGGPLKSYSDNGFGLWMIELKASQTPIGMCGLIKREYLENADIGYALLKEFEGLGYAYEIASATVNYAFEQLQMPRLAGITDDQNERSVRMLQKLRFENKGYVKVPGGEKELLYFVREDGAS